MTQEKIDIELEFRRRNRIIAAFMDVDLSHSYGNIPPAYQSSWDTIMRVVEKIEQIKDDHHGHFGVHINSNGCAIQGTNFGSDKIDINNPIYFSDFHGKNKIEATHTAIYNFILWYTKGVN